MLKTGSPEWKFLYLILALLAGALLLSGCGDIQNAIEGDNTPPIYWPPVDPPLVGNMNTVGFSCASVNNDPVCNGIEDSPGIWNSGEVLVSPFYIPIFYLNLDVTNNMITNANVFIHAIVTTSVCSEDQLIFDIVELAPDESASFHYGFNDIYCGMFSYHEAVISVYNAAGFNQADYPDPWMYPRTDLIANAVVMWQNRLDRNRP